MVGELADTESFGLTAVGAVIDFSWMTTVWDPQKIALCDHLSPLIRYVKVREAHTLFGRHITIIHCEVTGDILCSCSLGE